MPEKLSSTRRLIEAGAARRPTTTARSSSTVSGEPRGAEDRTRVAKLVGNLSDRRELLAQFTMLLFARIIDIPSPF
jgi:hypothetical protein